MELAGSPITKSHFKLGLSCIQKLKHARRKLPQQSQGDDMLKLLAEGGAAVEALARATEPGLLLGGFGSDALARSRVAILEALQAACAGKSTPIYEVTIEHGGFLARLDLLRIQPGQMELVEIKSTSEQDSNNAAPGPAFLRKDGGIRAGWVPYLQDLAFQRELLTQWLRANRAAIAGGAPDAVVPKLLLVNKDGTATAATVMCRENYKASYSSGPRGIRAAVEYVGRKPDRGLLVEFDMSAIVDVIDRDAHAGAEILEGQGLRECMETMRSIVARNRWPDAAESLGNQCRSCEFRVADRELSGFEDCWGRGSADVQGHILTLTRLSNKQCQEAMGAARERGCRARALVRDLPSDRVSPSQIMQRDVMGREVPAPVVVGRFAEDPLGRMRAYDLPGPISFLDFETSAYPIPARVGGAPFEVVPFQFEGHQLPSADASLSKRKRLEGFLDLESADPRRDSVDALIRQFGADGVIYHWSSFERVVLNSVRKVLLGSPAAGDSVRIGFIDTLVGPEGKGGGRLVDLLPIAKSAFYHPDMNGSYSIKKVVPIAWAVPEIRTAFKRGHGASGDPHVYEGDRDPYDGLPAAPRSLLEAVGGLVEGDRELRDDDDNAAGAIRNGGMAMLAYHYVRMFGDAEDRACENQLRAYCGLDSAAMLMVFALMRDHVGGWERRVAKD
jgi:hypothetical protein